jgi:hypothetical protein
VGDHLDTAPHSAWSGRIVIAKLVDPTRRRSTKCQPGARANLAVGSPPIIAPAPSLQGDPEEVPTPRRQCEGGQPCRTA